MKGHSMRNHSLNSLGQIITAAEKSDHNREFFSAETMRFFKCRVSEMVYPTFGEYGTLFVTSERDGGYAMDRYSRFYTVRRAFWTPREDDTPTLSLETVGEFQSYMSRNGAHKAAKRIALSKMVPADS